MRKLIFIFAFAVSAVFADDEKIADIIEKIRPSVVFIESFDRDDNLTAQGSGFFIDSKGSVVTSNYIFEKAYRATAKTSSGKEYPVEGITAKNIGSNVAQILVNIPDSNAPFLSLSTKIPSVGEQIYIVGSSI
ncbi:MAG: trypsin-like peptidase domain-containing protein, partial [Phycisphaerae bacterium]